MRTERYIIAAMDGMTLVYVLLVTVVLPVILALDWMEES